MLLAIRLKRDGNREPRGWERMFLIGKEDHEALKSQNRFAVKFFLPFMLAIAVLVGLLAIFRPV